MLYWWAGCKRASCGYSDEGSEKGAYQLIMDLQKEYGILQVLGHRDTSPDLNGDGVIEANEYVKVCPCFDVKEFLKSGREALFVWLVALMIPFLCLGCKGRRRLSAGVRRLKLIRVLRSGAGTVCFSRLSFREVIRK